MNSFNDDINNLLLNGFKDSRINYNDLILLVQNYCWNDGYKKTKINTLLVEYCKKWDNDYNEVIDRKIIKDAINAGVKRNIKNAKEINIYKEEIELIENIGDFKYQKLAFTMLFLSKLAHNLNSQFYNLDRSKDALVIKLSQVNISKKEYKFLLTYLNELGMIFPVDPERRLNNYHQILYARKEGELVFSFRSNDDNVIQKYIDYYGGELIYCLNCKKKTIRKGSHHLLCDECWKIHRSEKREIYNKDYYDSKK